MVTVRMLGLLLVVAGQAPAQATAQGKYQDIGGVTIVDRPAMGAAAPQLKQAKISLRVVNQTLEQVILEIARQAGVTPTYDSKMAVLQRRISATFDNASVQNALETVLKGTGVTARFSPNGQTFVLGSPMQSASARDSTTERGSGVIHGRVTDSATGRGIAGANVTVLGTKLAVVTTQDGGFVIRGVPLGEFSVSVKAFGYRGASKPVNVTGGKRHSIALVLVPVATSLSEVVTSVTGEQRKLEIGNAITSIKVDSVLRVAPVSNLTELLENRVPGLTVIRGSGQPGDPSRLRLRGASSINSSNDMIVVVDGVRVDAAPKGMSAASFGAEGSYLGSSPFDLIDPNSIETIDVFKGPSAAAMYGSDAANGVLVITTKRGRAGPTSITAATTRGVSYLPGEYPEGTYAYGWSRNATYGNARYGRCIPRSTFSPCDEVERIERYQALNDPYYTVLGHGETESYTLSASGGAPTALYSFTGSATSEIGLMKMSNYLIERYHTLRSEDMPRWMRRPDQYETLTGTGQIASQIKPNLQVRITTGASTSTQRKTALGNSAISTFIRLSKDETISDDQDQFYERMYRRTSAVTQTAQLDWTVRENIRMAANAGYNTTNITDETMLPAGFVGTVATGQYGTYSNGRQFGIQRTMNANGEVPLFRERIRLIAGVTYNSTNNESFRISSREVPKGVTRPNTFELGGSINTSSTATAGWYIEPRVNLRSRIFMMPGFRLDNNGLSGKNAGAFLLPKLNTSWIISDEDFFPWKNSISLLRLRLAGGVAGTQPGISDRLRLIQDGQVNGKSTNAAAFTSLGNTRLRPERSTEFEGGIDLDVWNGRAGIVYTLYNKVRYDAIERVDLAPSVILGGAAFSQNIGTIKNTGQEFEFRVTPIERLAVAWTTNGSVSMNTNRVVKLRAGLFPMTREGSNLRGGAARVVEGYPLWGTWARPLAGYEDVDHNGVLSADEVTLADSMVYLGQPDPKGTLSWSNNIRLLSGRLSFNTMTSYTWGMMQIPSYMRNDGSPFNTVTNKLDPTLEEQALAIIAGQTPYPVAQTVNTIRLQSISLNFVAPPHVARALKGRSVSVALQGSNLWMHSNYFGKDPNIGSPISDMTEDRGLIPQPRKWQLRFQWGN